MEEMSRDDLEKLVLPQDRLAIAQADNMTKMMDNLEGMVEVVRLLTKARWTQEKPREDGWYWAEDSFGEVHMVLVRRVMDYRNVWNPIERKESGVDDFDWYYGPLSFSPRLLFGRSSD